MAATRHRAYSRMGSRGFSGSPLPTLMAAAGVPDVVEKCKKGYEANGKKWRVHLDGHNFMPFFKGEVKMTTGLGFVPNVIILDRMEKSLAGLAGR